MNAMLDALEVFAWSGISLARNIGLGSQWDEVLSVGAVGICVPDDLVLPRVGGDLEAFKEIVGRLCVRVGDFVAQCCPRSEGFCCAWLA